MSGRRLISTRRTVPDAAREAYQTAWEGLRSAIVAAGAHAWRFCSPDDPARQLEFIEFRKDPRSEPAVAASLAGLQEICPGRSEEWVESPHLNSNPTTGR